MTDDAVYQLGMAVYAAAAGEISVDDAVKACGTFGKQPVRETIKFSNNQSFSFGRSRFPEDGERLFEEEKRDTSFFRLSPRHLHVI